MAVRSVSLVNKLEFDFQGTIYRSAIAFGDVDGDGGNELVVCNTSGYLYIFKGNSSKPWRVCNDELGCITTIVVDDVMNCGSSSILCLNTEGRCFIFSQTSVKEVTSVKKVSRDNKPSNVKGAKSSPSHASDILIKPLFVYDLPSNPKMAVVADVDGDGQNEVIVCYSDRFVRIFRFKGYQRQGTEQRPLKDDLQESTSLVRKLSKQPSKDDESKVSLSAVGKQSSKDSEKSKTPSPLSPKHGSKSTGVQEFSFDFVEGHFKFLQEFCFPGQIGSVASTKGVDGYTKLIVSQPAGGYAVLQCNSQDCGENIKQQNNESKSDCVQIGQKEILYLSLGPGTRHFNVNSEVIGSLKRQHEISGLFGICTLDGNYALIDVTSDSQDHKASQATEHQWFKMSKIDNIDGDDSIVICSWDGMTHVIDKNCDSAAYNFGENICDFCAGRYSINSNENVPCFCYVTFSNRIILYHNVDNLEKPKGLYETLSEKLEGRPEMENVLSSLLDKSGNIDPQKVIMALKNAS